MNEINYTIEGSLKMGLNPLISKFIFLYFSLLHQHCQGEWIKNVNKCILKTQVHEKESLENSLPHYGVVVALGSVYLFHYSCTKCTSLLGLKFI